MPKQLKNTLAIVNTKAPFASANGKESLDVALIMGSYEQPTSLFFIGDGVFQVIEQQNPDSIQIKDYLKTFAALEFYDIENLYVCQDSLIKRNLPEQFNVDNIQVLSKTALSEVLHQHSVIYRF